MITVLVITHGLFGQELLRTAQDIVGRQENVAALGVTSEMGGESLSKAIDDVVARLPSSEGYFFLVDMMGGTPCNNALIKSRTLNTEIVSGVNLYMVLSTFKNRASMDLKTLAERVAEDGRKAILLPKALLAKKLEGK